MDSLSYTSAVSIHSLDEHPESDEYAERSIRLFLDSVNRTLFHETNEVCGKNKLSRWDKLTSQGAKDCYLEECKQWSSAFHYFRINGHQIEAARSHNQAFHIAAAASVPCGNQGTSSLPSSTTAFAPSEGGERSSLQVIGRTWVPSVPDDNSTSAAGADEEVFACDGELVEWISWDNSRTNDWELADPSVVRQSKAQRKVERACSPRRVIADTLWNSLFDSVWSDVVEELSPLVRRNVAAHVEMFHCSRARVRTAQLPARVHVGASSSHAESTLPATATLHSRAHPSLPSGEKIVIPPATVCTTVSCSSSSLSTTPRLVGSQGRELVNAHDSDICFVHEGDSVLEGHDIGDTEAEDESTQAQAVVGCVPSEPIAEDLAVELELDSPRAEGRHGYLSHRSSAPSDVLSAHHSSSYPHPQPHPHPHPRTAGTSSVAVASAAVRPDGGGGGGGVTRSRTIPSRVLAHRPTASSGSHWHHSMPAAATPPAPADRSAAIRASFSDERLLPETEAPPSSSSSSSSSVAARSLPLGSRPVVSFLSLCPSHTQHRNLSTALAMPSSAAAVVNSARGLSKSGTSSPNSDTWGAGPGASVTVCPLPVRSPENSGSASRVGGRAKALAQGPSAALSKRLFIPDYLDMENNNNALLSASFPAISVGKTPFHPSVANVHMPVGDSQSLATAMMIKPLCQTSSLSFDVPLHSSHAEASVHFAPNTYFTSSAGGFSRESLCSLVEHHSSQTLHSAAVAMLDDASYSSQPTARRAQHSRAQSQRHSASLRRRSYHPSLHTTASRAPHSGLSSAAPLPSSPAPPTSPPAGRAANARVRSAHSRVAGGGCSLSNTTLPPLAAAGSAVVTGSGLAERSGSVSACGLPSAFSVVHRRVGHAHVAAAPTASPPSATRPQSVMSLRERKSGVTCATPSAFAEAAETALSEEDAWPPLAPVHYPPGSVSHAMFCATAARRSAAVADNPFHVSGLAYSSVSAISAPLEPSVVTARRAPLPLSASFRFLQAKEGKESKETETGGPSSLTAEAKSMANYPYPNTLSTSRAAAGVSREAKSNAILRAFPAGILSDKAHGGGGAKGAVSFNLEQNHCEQSHERERADAEREAVHVYVLPKRPVGSARNSASRRVASTRQSAVRVMN